LDEIIGSDGLRSSGLSIEGRVALGIDATVVSRPAISSFLIN
jgi:hypothetical protein